MSGQLVLTPAHCQADIELIFAPIINAGQANRRFTWQQTVPLTTWTVAHNLSSYPSVTVVDQGASVVIADVHYVDANTVQITFGTPQTGRAFFN